MSIWPKVNVPGRAPDHFVAWTQIGAAYPVVRVRFRDRTADARWRCDEHGEGRDVLCLHTFAALPLTSPAHDRWAATQVNDRCRPCGLHTDAPVVRS